MAVGGLRRLMQPHSGANISGAPSWLNTAIATRKYRVQHEVPTVIPRTIWICWLQGEQAMPMLVRNCVTSWRRLNPAWDVRVLSSHDLPGIMPQWNAANLSKYKRSHVADLLRLTLIRVRGGVWVDSTTFCMLPLDSWLDRATIGTGLMLIRARGTLSGAGPNGRASVVSGYWPSTHFIAATPRHYLVDAWHAEFQAGMARGPPNNYYECHSSLQRRCATDAKLRAYYDSMPQVTGARTSALPGHCPSGTASKRIRECVATPCAPYFKLAHHTCHNTVTFGVNSTMGVLFALNQ